MYLGSWKPDDFLRFSAVTHRADTGAKADADSLPAWEIYENLTGTPVDTGTMAKLNDAGTIGFYIDEVELVSATYEKGKSYTLLIEATVNAVDAQIEHFFQIEAEVDANTISAMTSSAADMANEVLEALALATGTAAAATASTITLDGAASALADYYNGSWVWIRSGTGAGQSRLIDDYAVTTKVATVSPNWITNPSTDSVFYVFPNGNVQGGSAPTAAAVADAVWDELTGDHVAVGSTGEAIAAAGSGASASNIADAVWDELTSEHVTTGTMGEAMGNAGSAASAASIADAVWDEVMSGHVAAGSGGAFLADASTGEGLLKLDLSTVTGEADRSVFNAIRVLRNRVVVNKNTGLVTVYKEDDTTTAWTANATLEERNAISEIDPT